MTKIDRAATNATSIEQDELIRVLANPKRPRILNLLTDAEMDVSTLAERLRLEASDVSKQLQPLRELGLVVVTPHKKRRVYGLSPAVAVAADESAITLTIVTTGGGALTLRTPRTRSGAADPSEAEAPEASTAGAAEPPAAPVITVPRPSSTPALRT